MCVTGSLLLILAAPPTLADVPAVERATPHFYGAVADRGPVTVTWELTPGSDIGLSLVVRGTANPGEVRKPDVKTLLAGRFQVIDRPDLPPADGVVRFAWGLRPVGAAAAEVPALPFAYYRPGFPEGRRMAVTYAEPVTVPAAPPPPAELFPEVPPAGATVPGWAWLVPVGLVAPAVLVGLPLARRLFPDAARRAELRRVAAVRDALDQLRGADAEAVAVAVRRYVRARPPGDGRPFDELLARCDAVRFGRCADDGLAATAAELVRGAGS